MTAGVQKGMHAPLLAPPVPAPIQAIEQPDGLRTNRHRCHSFASWTLTTGRCPLSRSRGDPATGNRFARVSWKIEAFPALINSTIF